MSKLLYTPVPTVMGTVTLVWRANAKAPRVLRVFLPSEKQSFREQLRGLDSEADAAHCPEVDSLAEGIQRLVHGEEVRLSLELLALDECPAFQREVLLADWAIPRGWVSTYGRVAKHLGRAGGARAVGRALAMNPFPLLIPCHRVIGADGRLCGFGGGVAMKRALLELEGVNFTTDGRAVMERVYY